MSRAQGRHEKKLHRAARKKARVPLPKRPAADSDISSSRKATQHYLRAASLREQGHFDDAIESFRKAFAEDPSLARALLQIANIRTHTKHDEGIEVMEAMYAGGEISDEQRMYLAFGLGKAHEDLRDYDKAFKFFAAGNAIKRAALGYPANIEGFGSRIARAIGIRDPSPTPMPKLEANFQLVRSLFDEFPFEMFRSSGFDDDTPIFIIGMPRSGTTLVEQILASHSQVHGAGELHDLARIGGTFLNQFGLDPRSFRNCDATEFKRIGKEYVRSLSRHAKNARFITDKMPGNFMFVGLIPLILPQARIIHCRRDPRDICTSIFKQFFAARDGLEYAYDLEDLGAYYKLYAELMNQWSGLLPGFVYDIRYEELVTDKERQIGSLLEHLGLDWEDSCLNFHKTDRRIKTRAEQARRPMYQSSVKSWQRYERQMKPLFKILPGS